MRTLNCFIGLCGRNADGFFSSGRGESRWAQSVARCLVEAGHEVYMAPDMEECGWGKCPRFPNAHLLQAHEKRKLNDIHFDIAFYSSWQTRREEALYIHADKYLWGVMSWKHEIMKDGYFKDNEFVARWFRADLPEIPYPINFRDRCFLIAQPFGKQFGESKFNNKRIAWVAKEAFLNSTRKDLAVAAQRHIFAIVDACKKTDSSLAIFSAHELDPKGENRVKELGVYDKLMELDRVTMYPTLPYKEYQEELSKCSVTVPVSFAGSIQESVFNGLVPLMYRDSMFSNHPWIKEVCSDLTCNKISHAQSNDDEKHLLTHDDLTRTLSGLLENKQYYENFLYRLRPMVVDNLDEHVLSQIQDLMNYKVDSENIRR
jgi:hypothetical protein